MNHPMILILSVLCLAGCYRNANPPIGMSPRIFRNTPGWNAARAIIREDTMALGQEIRNNNDLIYLRDPYYGQSLLFIAVLNNRIKSTEKLLIEGFDPNLVNDSSLNGEGTTPIAKASIFESISPMILKLLLDYGGNPNSKQLYSLRPLGYHNVKQDTINQHAITYAAYNSLEKVKLLHDYGANINPEEGISPLYISLTLQNMEISLYLLENGADYKEKFKNDNYVYQGVQRVDSATVADKLRYVILPIGSPEYEKKIKIIEFLKEKGLDYYKTPIPDNALNQIKNKYPDSWQEYLKVY